MNFPPHQPPLANKSAHQPGRPPFYDPSKPTETPISGSVGAPYYKSSNGTWKENPYHPSHRGKENKKPSRDSLSAHKPRHLQYHAQAPTSPPYGFWYAAQVISRRGVSLTVLSPNEFVRCI
jgi:hypothetical protein